MPTPSTASSVYSQLLSVLKLHRSSGLVLGQVLWQLKADNLFQKSIGAGIETWADFLKQPEIGLDIREANRAMELYGQFVLKLGYSVEDLAEAKTKSLHYLLPLVKSDQLPRERIDELVGAAKTLTINQFRESLYDAKTEDTGVRTYQLVLMRKCNETGTLQKVHGVDDAVIKEAFARAQMQLPDLEDLPEIL